MAASWPGTQTCAWESLVSMAPTLRPACVRRFSERARSRPDHGRTARDARPVGRVDAGTVRARRLARDRPERAAEAAEAAEAHVRADVRDRRVGRAQELL